MSIKLCSCHNKYDHEVNQIAEAISIAGIEKPARQQVFMLAGPNDILQIVADSLTWNNVAKVLVTAVGIPFLSQISKNAADELWKNRQSYISVLKSDSRSLFSSLSTLAMDMRTKTGLLSFGIDWTKGGRTDARRPAVTLPNLDNIDVDEQLLRAVISLSRHSTRLEAFFNHFGNDDRYEISELLDHSPRVGCLAYENLFFDKDVDLALLLRWRVNPQEWSDWAKVAFGEVV